MIEKIECIRLIEKELSGGKISKETIDKIDNYESDCLQVSGLRQDTFEYLISKYGDRFREIHFWKCPRIEDLTPIESLKNIEKIDYYWNQKATRFWNMSKNKNLKSFSFDDFTRMSDLVDLSSSSTLEQLNFGNSVSGNTSINSLEPIGEIISLKELSFNPSKILDNKVSFLLKLVNLKSLNFSNNLFSTEKIAWLVARLPKDIESDILKPYKKFDQNELNSSDILIVGKRKPFLNTEKDSIRISKYVDNFNRLVKHYQDNYFENEPD